MFTSIFRAGLLLVGIVLTAFVFGEDFRLETDDTVFVIERNQNVLNYKYLGSKSGTWNWFATPLQYEDFPTVFVNENKKQTTDWKLTSIEVVNVDVATNVVAAHFGCTDPAPMSLIITWTAHSGPGPIEQSINITNRGKNEITIGNLPSLSLRLQGKENNDLEHLWVEKGGSRPGDVGVHRTKIDSKFKHFATATTYNEKSRNTLEPIPWMCIHDHTARHGVYTALAASAHSSQSTELKKFTDRSGKESDAIFLSTGLNEKFDTLRSRIKPSETFAFPASFIGCYDGATIDHGCNRMHRWAEHWLLPQINDPKFPPVTNNTWGESIEIDEAVCKQMADSAAELGCEMFHVDAGWYKSMGYWDANSQKFPKGMRDIADHVHKKGMKFGLWVGWTQGSEVTDGNRALSVFEPTMKNWFEKDMPADWKAKPWRGETVCLGAPGARKWSLNELRRLIRDYGLDMLQHDQPLFTTECTRADHDHTSSKLDCAYSATNGYYEIYDTLRKEFPNLMLADCCNGGRVVDYGIMKRCDYVCATDGNDSMAIRTAFYDSSYPLPPRVLEQYVGAYNLDYLLTKKKYPKDVIQKMADAQTLDNFRYLLRSGMLGMFNIMINSAKWSDSQRKIAKRQIEIYKTVLRPLIRDANYFHIGPRPHPEGWDAHQYMTEDAKSGIIMVYRARSEETQKTFKLLGLDPARKYLLKFEDRTHQSVTETGKKLIDEGIAIKLPDQETSDIVFIQME